MSMGWQASNYQPFNITLKGVVLLEIYENLSLEDMEGEVWKDIEGYKGLYQVSNMGRVKSLERMCKTSRNNIEHYRIAYARILRQLPADGRYLRVTLYKNSKSKTIKVHRLVAETFIKNPLNKPTVDHINTIITDNRVCNLRWFTMKEQYSSNVITKAREIECLRKATNACKKKVRCITTGEEFECINDAVRKYKIADACIIRCCKGTDGSK